MPIPAGTQRQFKRRRARSANREKQWIISPADSRADRLAKSVKVSPLSAQVLINRGICDVQSASSFLRPRLTDLIRPDEMPGVEDAIARLKRAVTDSEKITIYGDYDVDGITGVSILWRILTMLGAKVDYYIPHRVDEGYGLNTDAVRSLAEAGTKVLITVDCGVCAIASAELARELAVDLIITDHHRPPSGKLPRAVAVVHPALDGAYPNQDSAGAMVAFKLAWALAERFSTGARLETDLREFMLSATSLAAMGTIADIVDLRGENRVLTSYGLSALAECGLAGIQALIESAGLLGKGLDSFDIGFRLGPMLNAAGRMGHARLAVELFTSDSPAHAMQIAEYLKGQNSRRQQCGRKIFKQACEMITQQGLDDPDRKSIVLAAQNWHGGVIGVVASRIVDSFHRPTIVISLGQDAGPARGSARSIPGFSIFGAIEACSQSLVRFGGHEMAAGITIEPRNIERFTAELEAYTQRNLSEADVAAKLHIDAVAPLTQFNKDVVNELQMLGPFGPGNPAPVFATMGVHLASAPRVVGSKRDHLQLVITDNTACIRCIGFGFARLEKKLLEQEFFNVAYQPQINTYNGSSNVEFILSDVRFD